MYPHERSLVQRLNGKPFALIGVNTDSDLAAIRQIVKDKELTWRSFYDGSGGAISAQYGVAGFPTVLLIDAQGIVREKYEGAPNAEKLDQAIDQLIAEIK